MAKMEEVKFGIEIETCGKTIESCAKLVSRFFNDAHIEYVGGYYNEHVIMGWKCMYDGSLRDDNNDNDYTCEIVSPLLSWDDIDLVCKLATFLKKNDVYTNSTCGIHVHVSHKDESVKALINMINIVNARYDLLVDACIMSRARRVNWNNKANIEFLEDVSKNKPKTYDELACYWYGMIDSNDSGMMRYIGKIGHSEMIRRSNLHYDNSRYQLCNLHSFYQGKGVEIRAFNSTLDESYIRAYVELSCAMYAKAINDKATSFRTRHNESNDSRQMCDFLWSMGIRGKDKRFKVTRELLIKNLDGRPWEK